MIPGISRWELLDVEKPARYLGGEWNQAEPRENPLLRVGLAFPDIYELGMSNIAIKILYEILDRRPEIAVERVFSPWVDFEALLKKKDLPLFTLESKAPLSNLDILGITLPYEMTYTNVLHLLELGRIPLLWKDRLYGPVVIGGGPSASNPLPMADFFDGFLIGDGEEALLETCDLFIAGKGANWSRDRLLEAISGIEGVWVPRFPRNVKKRVFKKFSNSTPPLKPIVSSVESVHDRVPLEIFRGCIQGCRFCNAGYFYRPKRDRLPEDLGNAAEKILQNTGEPTLGLISLSTSDFHCLGGLFDSLESHRKFPDQMISVPSLRMNDNTLEMLNKTSMIRKNGLTFAPEAGSQRLRDIIQKKITEEDIFKVIESTRDAGFRSVKLYFMVGLPFETVEDVDEIVTLVGKLIQVSRRAKNRKEFSVSVSSFVPKAHTPFQWAAQLPADELRSRRIRVSRGLKNLGVKVTWREEGLCQLEGVLSRGDEKVGKLLYIAHQKGCKFDGWTEHHRPDFWNSAFAEAGINMQDYLIQRKIDEPLPWDFIDFGVPKKFLIDELGKAAELAGKKEENAPL